MIICDIVLLYTYKTQTPNQTSEPLSIKQNNLKKEEHTSQAWFYVFLHPFNFTRDFKTFLFSLLKSDETWTTNHIEFVVGPSTEGLKDLSSPQWHWKSTKGRVYRKSYTLVKNNIKFSL